MKNIYLCEIIPIVYVEGKLYDMNIGYFRFKEDNIRTKTLNAMAHKFHGLNLISFGPRDVDMQNHTVNGMSLTSEGWERKEVPLPKLINNMPFKKTYDSELYHYLNNNSLLLFNSFGDKNTIEKLLNENMLLNDLIIPSIIVTNPSDVIDKLNEHKKLIFKPVDGTMGRGIFIIEKKEESFEYTDQDNYRYINRVQVKDLLESIKNRYFAQKYINSVTPKGLPFDIRVHYEKNGKGKWVKAQTYARVGISNDIVSNVAKGGSVIRAGLFLRTNFGDEKGRELLGKLNDQLKGFPNEFEKLYDFNISTLAVDLGLDDNNFYFFEVNSFPGGTFARGEIAMFRAAHAKYLAKRLLDGKKRIVTYDDLRLENERLKSQNEILMKENNINKDKLNQIVNSKSWKYTSVFRRKKKRV